MKDSTGIIANNLKHLRVNSGMTQEELSKKSGVSRSYIANIECGRKHSMSIQTLQKLAAKLNVCIYDLLEGVE